MRSRQELLDASGYANRPSEFDDLIRILDTELRLITPTDPERMDEGGKSKDENEGPDSDGVDSSLILHPSSFRYYQLAHDYLVHSLREWLGRRQRETRRGRAQLRLAERSMLWNAKPENRHLPSGLEWANIRLLTRTRDWTDPQRKMMRKVETRHLARALLVLFIGLVVRLGIEYYLYLHASTLVEQLKSAETQEIGGMMSQLSTCRRWANPRLVSLLAGTPPSSKEHLHASLALLSVDTSQVDYLYQRMLNADGVELSVIMDFLKPCKEQLVPKLWSILDSTEPGTISWRALPSPPSPSPSAAGLPAAATTAVPEGVADKSGDGLEPDSLLVEKQVMPAKSSLILRIAAILAHYDPANQGWGKTKSKISNELVQLDPVELAYWVDSLRPVKEVLIRALYDIRNDDKRPSTEKNIANVVLRDYGEELVTPKPGVMIGD